jgi:hypothetical protein
VRKQLWAVGAGLAEGQHTVQAGRDIKGPERDTPLAAQHGGLPEGGSLSLVSPSH